MAHSPIRLYTLVGDTQVLISETWLHNAELHRVDGPAWRRWKIVNGAAVLVCEEWYLEGSRHRVNGPAVRWWQIVDGLSLLTLEGWWLENKCHRVDGPAYQTWKIVNATVNEVSVLPKEKWYLAGIPVEPFALPSNRLSTTTHLQRCGLLIWPGLMNLISAYLV